MRHTVNAHIPVMRGKTPKIQKEEWDKHQSRSTEFSYGYRLTHDQGYWFLSVICQKLEDIRSRFGLEAEPPFGFHLTVGQKVDQFSKLKEQSSRSI